ncbi:MAG: LysR family transcriptional regulator [Cyanobacteria bacterium P01_F01_bin.86]
MELRHLRYFVAVAEELHFGRAAYRLHMAQQPLSRQIRNLEEELEVPLFHRTKRTIQLTEAGKVFLQEAHKTLKQADHAATLARKIGRGEAGELQIGFTGPILNSVLPLVVRHFKSRFPDMYLELKRLSTTEQVEALVSGKLHVGFLHPPIDTPLISQEVIYQEPLMAALPDIHPLVTDISGPLSIKHFAQEPFILFPRHVGPALYDGITGFCQKAGFHPRVVQEAFPQQTILGLVAAGLGVSLIHASVQGLHLQGVVIKPLVEVTPTLASAIAWHTAMRHPALPHLIDIVRTLAASQFNVQNLKRTAFTCQEP